LQRWLFGVTTTLGLALGAATPALAQAPAKKPNILVLWGDDIGYWNLSAHNQGMMGYKTPNIDRIAKEGARFTDWYGQQSCMAGRSAFITGQSPYRTGLLKVGLPGAKEGLQARDVTIAELLKAQGYMTGQFGNNHLGDLDEHLPTALNKKRMETIDAEVTKETIRFITDAKKADKPFFVLWNSTRMHIWTRLKESARGKTGLGVYPDGMVEHDGHVGEILNALKELGLDENTIVMYSTGNGAEKFSRPDGGTSPFRGEKNTNWEGGYRVPTFIRWPGAIKPGTVQNDVFAHEDMLPTLLAAAGVPDVKEKLTTGMPVGNKTFKVHLDGCNLTDAFAGKASGPRHEFFYWNDDGQLVGLRYDQWKLVFAEQQAHGAAVWRQPFTTLRAPKIFNLRSDPFEIGDVEGMDRNRWWVEHIFLLVPAQQYVAQFIGTFREFPPSQKAGTFSLDAVLQALQTPGKNDCSGDDRRLASLRFGTWA
jgi:arylsulfatase